MSRFCQREFINGAQLIANGEICDISSTEETK